MKDFLQRVWHQLWTIFLNGLLTILPIAITIALFTFVARIVNSWLVPINRLEPEMLRRIPGSAAMVAIIFIFLIGAIIKLFVLEPLIHFIESFFLKIPLMSQVYGGIKQLVQAFTIQDEMTFKKVVMIPFPTPKTYSLGFLTSQVSPIITGQHRYYNVFVPTTPNPTSGFLVQVAEADMKVVDLTRQEAISLIISGGIIVPDRFK